MAPLQNTANYRREAMKETRGVAGEMAGRPATPAAFVTQWRQHSSRGHVARCQHYIATRGRFFFREELLGFLGAVMLLRATLTSAKTRQACFTPHQCVVGVGVWPAARGPAFIPQQLAARAGMLPAASGYFRVRVGSLLCTSSRKVVAFTMLLFVGSTVCCFFSSQGGKALILNCESRPHLNHLSDFYVSIDHDSDVWCLV